MFWDVDDVDPSLSTSGKVSSQDRVSTGAGISPAVAQQMETMFAGLIQKGMERDAIRSGHPAIRESIIREIDERSPDWRMHRAVASALDSFIFNEPDMIPFFQREVARQDPPWDPDVPPSLRRHIESQEPGWEETARRLWSEGRYAEYNRHMGPVRRAAFDAKIREGPRTRTPRWKVEMAELLISEGEVLRQARQADVPTDAERFQRFQVDVRPWTD